MNLFIIFSKANENTSRHSSRLTLSRNDSYIFLFWNALLRTIFLNVCLSRAHSEPSVSAWNKNVTLGLTTHSVSGTDPDGGCPRHVVEEGQLTKVPLVIVSEDCLEIPSFCLYEGAVDPGLHDIEVVTVVVLVDDELPRLLLLFKHGVNDVSQLGLVQGFEKETSLNSVL